MMHFFHAPFHAQTVSGRRYIFHGFRYCSSYGDHVPGTSIAPESSFRGRDLWKHSRGESIYGVSAINRRSFL